MSESVRFSAKKQIDGLQTTEQELLWTHESGINVLSYLDGVGGDYFIELKSCRDAYPPAFQRQAFYDGYLHQVATYYMGLLKLNIDIPCFIIACEKTPPYSVSINKVGTGILEELSHEGHYFISEFAEWLQEPTRGDYQHWVPYLGYYDWSYLPKR